MPLLWVLNAVGALSLYTVSVIQLPVDPKISFLDYNTPWPQSFNPAWVVASPGTKNVSGLLIRSQNCTAGPGECVFCNVDSKHPIEPWFPGSVLSFAAISSDGSFATPYLVFAPEGAAEDYGTEDPRLAYDAASGLYHLMYTCYSSTLGANLCHAVTSDPTLPYPGKWNRLGKVFPSLNSTKSGAMLIRDKPPHYLYWGDTNVHLATSFDLLTWTNVNMSFISPRPELFDSRLVEAGPLPLPLSDGNYIFFHNSANTTDTCYHPGFVILSGADPSVILQRSEVPLLSPIFDWQIGKAPFACNVPCVVFLEAAAPVEGQKNVFDVWFGGSDAVIGTARIRVSW